MDGKAATTRRGGRRDPLPKFNLVIPNYKKHQPNPEHYIRILREMRHDRKLAACCDGARWMWVALCCAVNKEGRMDGITLKDVAFEATVPKVRDAERRLRQLIDVGLIKIEGHFRVDENSNPEQTQSNPISNPSQTQSEPKANPEQTQVKPFANPLQTQINPNWHEETPDGAGLMPHIVEKSIEEESREKESLPLSPIDQIHLAMRAKGIPSKGADPDAYFRAMAVKFISRKPDKILDTSWRDWISRAIIAVPPDDRWLVRVNDCLKTSALTGAYIEPEMPRPDSRRTDSPPPTPPRVRTGLQEVESVDDIRL